MVRCLPLLLKNDQSLIGIDEESKPSAISSHDILGFTAFDEVPAAEPKKFCVLRHGILSSAAPNPQLPFILIEVKREAAGIQSGPDIVGHVQHYTIKRQVTQKSTIYNSLR